MKSPGRHAWFIKHGEKVTGPFPAKLLLKWRILGRVRADTLVSVDQTQWQPAGVVAELDPVQHYGDPKDPLVKERIAAVVRWEDDRFSEREEGTASAAGSRGTHASRLEQTAQARDKMDTRRTKHQIRQTWLFALTVLVAGAAAWPYLPRMISTTPPDCSAPPAPEINWNYCRLDGAVLRQAVLARAQLQNSSLARANLQQANLAAADLSFANLSLATFNNAVLRGSKLTGANLRGAVLTGADLTNADLSYVDLSQAEVGSALLSGAKLDKTIWIDGRVCAVGSVGKCN